MVAPDQRVQVLEQKLAIYVHGTASARRNPALDVLVGRVPDARLAPLAAAMANVGPAAGSTAAVPSIGQAAPSTAATASSGAASVAPSALSVPPVATVAEPHRHGPARATTQPFDGYPTPVASPRADAGARQPAAMVVPVAAVRMAAVARAKRSSSPWLAAGHSSAPRLRLQFVEPPRPSLWTRLRRRLAALLAA